MSAEDIALRGHWASLTQHTVTLDLDFYLSHIGEIHSSQQQVDRHPVPVFRCVISSDRHTGWTCTCYEFLLLSCLQINSPQVGCSDSDSLPGDGGEREQKRARWRSEEEGGGAQCPIRSEQRLHCLHRCQQRGRRGHSRSSGAQKCSNTR